MEELVIGKFYTFSFLTFEINRLFPMTSLLFSLDFFLRHSLHIFI